MADIALGSLKQGEFSQIQGPFGEDSTFYFNGKSIKLGIFIGERDLMTFNWQFPIDINGERIIVGKSGMYEPNVSLPITRLGFPLGAPASVYIDYVVLEI